MAERPQPHAQYRNAAEIASGIRSHLTNRKNACIPISDNTIVTLSRRRSVRHPLRRQTTMEVHHRYKNTSVYIAKGVDIVTFPRIPIRKTREPIVQETLDAKVLQGTDTFSEWSGVRNYDAPHQFVPPEPDYKPTLTEIAGVLMYLDEGRREQAQKEFSELIRRQNISARLKKSVELLFNEQYDEKANQSKNDKKIKKHEFDAKWQMGELEVSITYQKGKLGLGKPGYTIALLANDDTLWSKFTIDGKSNVNKTDFEEKKGKDFPLAELDEMTLLADALFVLSEEVIKP